MKGTWPGVVCFHFCFSSGIAVSIQGVQPLFNSVLPFVLGRDFRLACSHSLHLPFLVNLHWGEKVVAFRKWDYYYYFSVNVRSFPLCLKLLCAFALEFSVIKMLCKRRVRKKNGKRGNAFLLLWFLLCVCVWVCVCVRVRVCLGYDFTICSLVLFGCPLASAAISKFPLPLVLSLSPLSVLPELCQWALIAGWHAVYTRLAFYNATVSHWLVVLSVWWWFIAK